MTAHTLFETVIHAKEADNIDLDALYNSASLHAGKTPSVKLSNSGYQAHYFKNDEFERVVRENVPQRHDKPFKSFDIQPWVNFNKSGDWNDVHNHEDEGVILSGVLYVRAPQGCGNIRMYDARGMSKSRYNAYYEEGKGSYLSITPHEGMMLFFPPYLLHSVEPNMSGHIRLSIAFNITNAVY